MKYLNIKLRRDLLKNWTQFFSVFLMALLSVLIFVGLQGAWQGLKVSVNNYIDTANLPEVWIHSTNLTEEDVQQIKEIDGIRKVAKKIRVTASMPNDADKEKYISIDTIDTSELNFNLLEGKKISVNEDGIWLNKEYADRNNIKVGEKIEIELANQKKFLSVLGFIQSADKIYYTGSLEFIAPSYADYGYGIVSEKTLEKYFSYSGNYNLLEIYGSNKDLRQEVESILGDKNVAYYDRATLVDVSDALDRVGQIKNLSFLFSFIFILLAILAMYTTIRRLIEKQTQEIAVLKALGFSNRKVGFHYSSFGLIIGGMGAICGAAISPFMSWFVLGTQKSMFSLPEWRISYSWSSLVVIVLVVAICVFSAFFAAREVIHGLPALFLRGGTEKRGHTIFFERIHVVWNTLKIENRWAIRDASINKVRLFMGIVGVAGSMMLLIAGFGMPQSINHLVDKAYNNDFTYEYRLGTTNYEKVKDEYEGQWVQITQARYSPDDGYNRLLIVLGDGNYVNMRTEENEKVQEGGLYITKGFAERANLKKGDKLTVFPTLDDKEYSFEIKGIITSETNQGAYIMQDTWEKSGGEFRPQTLLTGKDTPISEVEKNPDINSIIKMEDQKQNAYDFVDSLMSVFLMIIAFAVMLVIVVLYNLGSLNFVERTRDYATLRVLGFHKKELKKITMIENISTTFLGWLLGIPLGLWFLDQYVRTFSTIRLEYTAYVNIQTLGLATVFVWVFSMTTTFFISRRIRKLDMVEALKGVE